MKPQVDSFGIALPPDWVRFPLEDGDFEAFVRGQRDRVRRETKLALSRTAERQFEVLMRGLRNDCDSAGIRMVATLLGVVDAEEEVVDTEEEPEGDGQSDASEDEAEAELIAASMTIAVVSQAEVGSELPLTVNTIQVAMSMDPLGDDDSEADDPVATNLEPPSVVTMPVGDAVKLVRLHRLKYPESRGRNTLTRELPVFVQHFFVPIDDLGSAAAVVTFNTPMVSLARPMSELFDAMMETFEMFSGDDITDPGGMSAENPSTTNPPTREATT